MEHFQRGEHSGEADGAGELSLYLLIAILKKTKNLYVMKLDSNTGLNIKRVSPAGAMRNMRRGTGVWCAIVVLAVVGEHLTVWRGGSMEFEGEAMG